MGPLRAGSVAAASVEDQPSEYSLAFADEPKGSCAVKAPASGPLRGRWSPGCPAMGARSLQAAHCSARPHSQPQGVDAMLLYAAALHVSIATPIRCHLRTAASAQHNLIACLEASGALAGRSWPARPLPAGAPFPLGVSAAVGSRPSARAAAPRVDWASPGPTSGKLNNDKITGIGGRGAAMEAPLHARGLEPSADLAASCCAMLRNLRLASERHRSSPTKPLSGQGPWRSSAAAPCWAEPRDIRLASEPYEV